MKQLIVYEVYWHIWTDIEYNLSFIETIDRLLNECIVYWNIWSFIETIDHLLKQLNIYWSNRPVIGTTDQLVK